MDKPIILCVDDEKSVLNALRDEIKFELGNDFSIEISENGEEALGILNDFLGFGMDVPVIISDQLMPGMKGDELLIEVFKINSAIRTILLTGQATAESVGNAVNKARLYRFISKPWDGKDLILTVREAAKSYFTDAELDARIKTLNDINISTQALSELITTLPLVEKVLALSLTHTDADGGVLILYNDDRQVRMGLRSDKIGNEISYQNIDINSGLFPYPVTLIEHVLETGSTIVSDRISKEIPFINDPYVAEARNQKKGIKSAYCTVIEKNKKVIGVFYLESHSKSGIFTGLKQEYLSVLLQQSGVSLDNAHLYENLEHRVQERTQELNEQKEIIEKKNADITDSIRYARRIQSAILPDSNLLYEYFPESFIMYHPKDIVSGDFYWMAEIDGELFVAVVDCTGHGVPGAFMSVMGNSLLNDAILQNKITETDEILNRLHHGIVTNLERSHKGDLLQDGMDMSLIKINRKTKRIQYSGANRPLIYMNGDEIVEYEPDKMSIGYSIIQTTPSTVKYFSKQEFTYQDGATIIQYSDGITDQFGGPNYRKFSNKSFIELLKCLRLEPAQEQCKSLTNVIRSWQGDRNQTDDMLVISIKLS